MFGGVPAQALTKAHGQHLIISGDVRDEWLGIVREMTGQLSAGMALRFQTLVHAALAAAEGVEVAHRVTICRDPKDNAYLSPARSGSAEILVTGDHDLLTLEAKALAGVGLSGLRILTPRDSLDRT
ncbi:MAG: putative toxin-antitoxin system toxin component, PIN family [bacterium]